jgi:hypothetical protein
MPKVAIGITLVLLLAGSLAMNVEAAPLTGSTTLRPATNYSLVEKAACGGEGLFARCERGLHWEGHQCVPCPVALTCNYPNCWIRRSSGYVCTSVQGVPPHACPRITWTR